jgi:HAE1 family hydrophobic/amphiphilic exporter-1
MLFVLIVSLVEAFLILPNHLYHALEKSGVREGRVQQWVDNGVNWLRDRAVVPMATWAVKWRYLTFGCAIGALMLAVAAVVGGLVKFSPFPDLDGNVMEARIMLPQGTPLKRTEDVVARIDAALERVNQQLKGDQPGGSGPGAQRHAPVQLQHRCRRDGAARGHRHCRPAGQRNPYIAHR